MAHIQVTGRIAIDSGELVESFARASGPGGQHVNTTDSAVILRFNIFASPGLPDPVKRRLARLAGSRLTQEGELVLRSEGARSQLVNRREVRERLLEMIRQAAKPVKKRRPTKPTKGSQQRRLDGKTRRAAVKANRGKVRD